ncbi:MAG: hypothetical protein JWO63_2551 [Frankiales bacterium]|nr:hypothetical protein [Frankiales bacterium]
MVTTALFTVTLAVAGLALIFTVGKSLLNTLDSSAERTGGEVAALVKENKLPNPVLAGSGGVSLVQVVDADNRVVAASPGGYSAVSILHPGELARIRDGRPLTISGDRASTGAPVRVVGVRADVRGVQRTVLVATDLDRVLDSSRLLAHILLIAGPIVVLMMAALTWWIVGRTLRPVAALQRGAEELSAAGLSRSRLPIPAAEDEISSLATTLNAMLDRLDRANTKQRRFVGDAAHELRSPIASLRVQLEVAERTSHSADVGELTREALIDVDRLSRLIDDLLALARSDERGALTSRAPIRLDELVTDILSAYQDQPVSVQPAELTRVIAIGDRNGLQRVLVNLVDNAVRYAHSSVRVGAGTAEHDWVYLSVTDDGPGIPADKREQVFDRFYRLDTARSREAGGTGLGLSIAREIVAAHGGQIQLADNHPGLAVRVLLPGHS